MKSYAKRDLESNFTSHNGLVTWIILRSVLVIGIINPAIDVETGNVKAVVLMTHEHFAVR